MHALRYQLRYGAPTSLATGNSKSELAEPTPNCLNKKTGVPVPQGSILSVTLFCLNINSIVKALCPGVECSLDVDDFVICYRSKHIYIIERHLEGCLNNLRVGQTPTALSFLPQRQRLC